MAKIKGFEDFILACEADARGRSGFESTQYPQGDLLRKALTAVVKVHTKDLDEINEGPLLGEKLKNKRIEAIRDEVINTQNIAE